MFYVAIDIEASTIVTGDKGQIEQVLLNLIKNAKEAQGSTGKTSSNLNENCIENDIEVKVLNRENQVIIKVFDQGCGLANIDNLFIPFYTTKPEGSGIGLALSRQIINNHDGELTLTNRLDQTGAVASITLPKV